MTSLCNQHHIAEVPLVIKMSRPSVRSQLDQYGFSMSLTPSEDAARKQCSSKAQKREERYWGFESSHSSISSTASHAEIKQRCRKVLPVEGCWFPQPFDAFPQSLS